MRPTEVTLNRPLREHTYQISILSALTLAGFFSLVLMINFATRATLVLATVVIASAAEWSILRKVTGQQVPMPGILMLGINAIGVLGYLWYPDVADHAAVSATLPETPDVYNGAAAIFATASLALFLGGLLGRGRKVEHEGKTSVISRAAAAHLTETRASTFVIVAAIPLIILITAYTPSGLWRRDHYSEAFGPHLFVLISGSICPVGMALTALLICGKETPRGARICAYLLLTGYLLTAFSMGSRGLAFLPIMLLVMSRVGPRPERASRWRVIATTAGLILVSAVFLQVPLSLRGSPAGAGLSPYWHIVTTDPGSLMSWDQIQGSVGNILFSVPLAGMTNLVQPFPHHYFATSLSPLPGSFTDWGSIKQNLRLNLYTPTSAIGELANYGTNYLVGFFLVFGWVLSRLQAWNAKLPASRAVIASVAGFGISSGLAFALLQYNLRAGLRGVWYFAMLSVALHLWPQMKSASEAATYVTSAAEDSAPGDVALGDSHGERLTPITHGR